MLYDQLSPLWQEKVIKAEKSRPEGQNWVRISTGGNLSKKDLLEFLHCHNIQNTNVQKRDNFFLVHCTNEENALRALQLNGEILGRNVLRLTRSDIPLTAREIFKLIGDKLRVKEEIHSRRK